MIPSKVKCAIGLHNKEVTGECPVTHFKVWKCVECGKDNVRKHGSSGSRFN